MLTYITDCLNNYSSIFPNPAQVVEHMFAVNGNNVYLNNKGYIKDNYGSKECFKFPDPEPLAHIYPWTDSVEFQPFRNLAGCRDVGFKETAQYFIDCVKLTPDTVEGIVKWKQNIDLVEQILIGTPSIEDEYPDMEEGYKKFITKLDGANRSVDKIRDRSKVSPIQSVTKQWYFDVQWSDCPDFVENEIREMWIYHELGNNDYVVKTQLNQNMFDRYPNVYYWLKHSGVKDGEKVIIHWWW